MESMVNSSMLPPWGEYRLLPFLAICQKLKMLWHFEIFVNTEPYGAGNFKALLLQFSSNVNQTSWGHCAATMGEYRLLLSLQLAKFKKKIVALWNFNMGLSMKFMKFAISWKWLTVERNGWNFGTRGARNSLCRVGLLFRSGHLNSVWDHSVHIRHKISDAKIVKRLLLRQFSSNLIQTLWKAW